MLHDTLKSYDPLKFLNYGSEIISAKGDFGAVLARSGVGKTAFLVQTAFNFLLEGKKILHIGIDDSVEKISLRYKEIFQNITAKLNSDNSADINQVWEDIQPNKFIMTFKNDAFSTLRLEERINELKNQDIFSPDVVFIDGLEFDNSTREILPALKNLAKNYGFFIWFTIRTHRHESSGHDGMPLQITGITDLFNCIIQLQPEKEKIYVKSLKGEDQKTDHDIYLDPTTMIIQK